jgi:putative membrane protein
MMEIQEDKTPSRVRNRRVHMANERTFLAWIRTSIGIMAFGFVVEKFALFVKQLSYFILSSGLSGQQKDLTPLSEAVPLSRGYSSVFGIVVVGLGTLMGVLAFMRYKIVERQIDEDTYRPSIILNVLLASSISAVGIFLILYLVHSV